MVEKWKEMVKPTEQVPSSEADQWETRGRDGHTWWWNEEEQEAVQGKQDALKTTAQKTTRMSTLIFHYVTFFDGAA